MRLPDCFKLAINKKITMTSQLLEMMLTSMFFDAVLFLLPISYWYKFHRTSFAVMTLFFCKGFTRNPEIGNTPV